MSFWLVQITSVVGVAAVILLTWLVGWGRRAEIAGLDAAAARFKADFPAADIKSGAIAKDRRVALLDLGDGFGLVTVLGDELVTRQLRANDIAVSVRSGALLLHINDSTLARVRVALDDSNLGAWVGKLNTSIPKPVMAGLDPAIHAATATESSLDGRHSLSSGRALRADPGRGRP